MLVEESVKLTARGAVPLVGVPEKFATGACAPEPGLTYSRKYNTSEEVVYENAGTTAAHEHPDDACATDIRRPVVRAVCPPRIGGREGVILDVFERGDFSSCIKHGTEVTPETCALYA